MAGCRRMDSRGVASKNPVDYRSSSSRGKSSCVGWILDKASRELPRWLIPAGTFPPIVSISEGCTRWARQVLAMET